MLTPRQPIDREQPKLDIPSIISGLTQQESTFTRQQLEAAIAVEAQGIHGASDIEGIVERAFEQGLASQELEGLIRLESPGEKKNFRRKIEVFTTREMLQLEQAMSRPTREPFPGRATVLCSPTGCQDCGGAIRRTGQQFDTLP